MYVELTRRNVRHGNNKLLTEEHRTAVRCKEQEDKVYAVRAIEMVLTEDRLEAGKALQSNSGHSKGDIRRMVYPGDLDREETDTGGLDRSALDLSKEKLTKEIDTGKLD